jgi:hypothetical protein
MASQTLPARSMGSVATVLRQCNRNIRDGDASVPCGACTACCRAPTLAVDLVGDEPSRYRCHLDRDGSRHILDKNPDGSCVYLVDGRCSIYHDRPKSCRRYDCRPYALTGVLPCDDPVVIEAINQWRVEHKTTDDKDAALALRLAVAAARRATRNTAVVTVLALQTWPRHLPQARAMRQKIEGLPPEQRHAFLKKVAGGTFP